MHADAAAAGRAKSPPLLRPQALTMPGSELDRGKRASQSELSRPSLHKPYRERKKKGASTSCLSQTQSGKRPPFCVAAARLTPRSYSPRVQISRVSLPPFFPPFFLGVGGGRGLGPGCLCAYLLSLPPSCFPARTDTCRPPGRANRRNMATKPPDLQLRQGVQIRQRGREGRGGARTSPGRAPGRWCRTSWPTGPRP